MAILQSLSLSTPARRAGSYGGVFASLVSMLRAVESRRQLAQLDTRMLADIGLGHAEARAEADRAPWDLAQRHR